VGLQPFRPECNEVRDPRIWPDVDANTSAVRSVGRDGDRDGREMAAARHENRYRAAELIYIEKVPPRAIADLVIDNRDFAEPRLLLSPPRGRPYPAS
jgi:uridine kinase